MKKTEKVKPIPALREPSLVEPLGEQAAQRAAQPALKAESPPGQVPRDLPRAAPIKARAWKTTIAPRNAGGDDDQASRMIHMEKIHLMRGPTAQAAVRMQPPPGAENGEHRKEIALSAWFRA